MSLQQVRQIMGLCLSAHFRHPELGNLEAVTCTAKTDLWRTELAVGGAVDLPEVLWHLGVVTRRGMQSGAYVDWSFALLRPLLVQRRQLDTGRRYTDVRHDPPAALVLAGSAFSEQERLGCRRPNSPPRATRSSSACGPRPCR